MWDNWKLGFLTNRHPCSCTHWQLCDLTVVRSDSCLIWQLISDSCLLTEMSGFPLIHEKAHTAMRRQLVSKYILQSTDQALFVATRPSRSKLRQCPTLHRQLRMRRSEILIITSQNDWHKKQAVWRGLKDWFVSLRCVMRKFLRK